MRCEWQSDAGKQCDHEASWFAVSQSGARYPRCYDHGFPSILLEFEPGGPMCKPISELPEWLSAQKVMRYCTGRPSYSLAVQEGIRKAREGQVIRCNWQAELEHRTCVCDHCQADSVRSFRKARFVVEESDARHLYLCTRHAKAHKLPAIRIETFWQQLARGRAVEEALQRRVTPSPSGSYDTATGAQLDALAAQYGVKRYPASGSPIWEPREDDAELRARLQRWP